MNTTPSPETAQAVAALMGLDDLYSLRLVEGLPAEQGGKTIRYTLVKLRETNVADERIATRLAERVVPVGGKPTLLVSDADFRVALTMRHCHSWHCVGIGDLYQDTVDIDTFGKLNPYDLARIEDRIMLISLAAQARHGNITMAEVEQYLSGNAKASPPQSVGQAAAVGSNPHEPGPGPALLADFTRDGATGAAAGHGTHAG
jgi:phage FluMu protein gp41